MKRILIHVKNIELIHMYENFLKNGYDDNVKYSKEVKNMIDIFNKDDNWNVYLTSIENLDYKNNIFNNIYNTKERKYESFTIDEINSLIDVMVIRVIGSIEGNFYNVKEYLEYISNNYKGLVINNPNAMKKGMTKHYLCEIDRDYLKSIGIGTIDTKIYSNKVELDELKKEYKDMSKYIIKPVSGELSNSLSNLGDIDENFLRYKESKVLGWVIQPIMKEIWNGEFQMLFLNSNLIYSQYKEYAKDGSIPNQKSRSLHKYKPTTVEIDKFKKLIDYFKRLYNIEINICRIDFMKDESGEPILLEFEMVNPGFFIGYMQSDDEDIAHIINEIKKFCESKIEKID